MNWFKEQLYYREEADAARFEEAMDSIANAVMGKRLRDALSSSEIADSAVSWILNYYHIKNAKTEIPKQLNTAEEQLEYCLQPYGIKSRSVSLDKGWYKYASGVMLGTLKEDGTLVILIPGKFNGYKIINLKSGGILKLGRKTEQLLDNEAYCFYMPLPLKPLKIKDLFLFMATQLNASDVVLYLVLMAVSAGIGLLSPLFAKRLFGTVLESNSISVLMAIAVFMVCYSVSKEFFSFSLSITNARMETKLNIAVQAALMNRIISMPTSFFRNFSSGELAQRAAFAQNLCSIIFKTIGMTGLTSVFSLIYIGQIFSFAPQLVIPALVVVVSTIIFSVLTIVARTNMLCAKMEIAAKTSGITYATIKGIQKVKLAGAERRMFARWADKYAEQVQIEYNPPAYVKLNNTIGLAISLLGNILIFTVAAKKGISVPDYYAFNTAYALISGTMAAVVSLAATMAEIKPSLMMAKPILEADPEFHGKKENILELKGGIELSHVSFRYDNKMPNVIDDLSLRIAPGEYLAVTGATGCGKSTLMRLLLGFEMPQKGSIFYDGKDISLIDIESLRKKIGTVMQNGKLFLGDIYSNIVITAPELGIDRAWEAAKIASIDEDIHKMPMGMHTIVSENGGFSGGQKQRLMIARAVAPGPKILIFDEATSALDNYTQKKVTEAIDSLKCTRIIIAHRLSTIKNADRIIYLENGRVEEEGTYETLLAKNGKFAKLVERQRLDIE